MIYKSSTDWQPVEFDYPDSVLEMIKFSENNIIIAGPGAGKTELLAQKACYLLETGLCRYPYSILAITFKNDATRNIKSRVHARCNRDLANNFVSMTFHAFCKQILDQFREILPDCLKPRHDYTINGLSWQEWKDVKKNTGLKECGFEYGIVCKLKAHQKEKVNNFWNNQLHLINNGKSNLTFNMVIALAIYIIYQHSDIADVIRKKYPYIFVDEFQDTTNAQYYLLQILFKGKNNSLTVVADFKQTIMTWAGALKDIGKKFQDDFKTELFTLNVNYRSNNKVVALVNDTAKYMIKNDKTDNHMLKLFSQMKAIDKHTGDDQSIRINKDFTSHEEQYDQVKQEILNLVHEHQIKPHDILIIRRQKVQEVEDYFSKISDNITLFNADKKFGKYSVQDLQDDRFAQFIIAILSLIYNVKIDTINSWEIFYSTISTLEGVNEYLDTDTFFAKCIYIINNIKNETQDISNIKDILDCPTFKDCIQKFILNCTIFGYNDENQVKNTKSSFIEYLNFLDKADDWQDFLEKYHGINSVHLMTIHKSKGLEYDTVFFIDVDGDTFWSNNEINTQFFVACSRAKERVRIYASQFKKSEDITKLLDHLIDKDY